jgi:hypothetical protein
MHNRMTRLTISICILAALASAAQAQSEGVTGEARRFLVYPLASLVQFIEQANGGFNLSYQSQPAMPCYYFNVNAIRFVDEKTAVQTCKELMTWHRAQGYTVSAVNGYACAFVADKRNDVGTGSNQCTRGPKIVTQLRSTGYVVGPYFGELAEASTPPKDAPAPTGPLLAALKGGAAPPADETMAERCLPLKTSEALGKAAAIDTEDTLQFLRRQLAVKSDFERICFNSAIRRYPEAVESVMPAYYDALQARATYQAALDARKRWFGAQTAIEERQSRSSERDIDTMQSLGTAVVGTSIAPAALVATAISGYRIALENLRDLVVLPPFHEGLYERYRGLRAQHDSVEAFDLATQSGSAYHMLTQQMTPVAGAQKLSGEERSRVIARYWRTRLEARYQTDLVIAKGPPTEQVNAALAPARRCIGGLRQEVAQCVQEAERTVGR